jgi:uncharacterized protein YecT (DUF1311 family)
MTMQAIENKTARTTGGSAHPAMLLALAIGVAIGACLSGAPARSAEAGAAAAATWHYDGDAEYRRCIARSDGTNTAWGLCGTALIEREDIRLNAAWKRVYAAGAETKSKDLLDEQRAWNAFKETSCRFYASGTFGREGQVLSFPVCRAGIIAQRTAILEGYGADDPR